jgi:hypothetical protein
MKRHYIYLEGDEKIITQVLRIARVNLGKGINVIDLTPCINKQEIISKIRDFLDNGEIDDIAYYLDDLERSKTK